MNFKLVIATLLTGFSVSAFATQGPASGGGADEHQPNGGMSDCLVKSVAAALASYSGEFGMAKIPTFTVSESNGSPSNGIDVMVTFDSKITYFVIASPVSTPDHSKLLGCSAARVDYVKR